MHCGFGSRTNKPTCQQWGTHIGPFILGFDLVFLWVVVGSMVVGSWWGAGEWMMQKVGKFEFGFRNYVNMVAEPGQTGSTVDELSLIHI